MSQEQGKGRQDPSQVPETTIPLTKLCNKHLLGSSCVHQPSTGLKHMRQGCCHPADRAGCGRKQACMLGISSSVVLTQSRQPLCSSQLLLCNTPLPSRLFSPRVCHLGGASNAAVCSVWPQLGQLDSGWRSHLKATSSLVWELSGGWSLFMPTWASSQHGGWSREGRAEFL